MQDSPSFAEVLMGAIDAAQSRVWVALPARVASYDPTTQTVVTQPTVANVYYNEDQERVPERLPVVSAPVMFPGSGIYSVTWPIKKGDLGILIFTSCALSRWLAGDGREVDPVDERRGHLSDAVFIAGVRPEGAAIAHHSS